jgi:hypothetical protein
MKKIKLLIVFSFMFYLIIGQSTSSIVRIGYCRYSNTYFDYNRINGFTLGYAIEKKFNDIVFYNFGLGLSYIQERFSEIDYYATINSDGSIIIDKTKVIKKSKDGFSININTPFDLKVNLYDSKLFLSTGITLDYRMISVNDYNNVDPELGNRNIDLIDYYRKIPVKNRKLSYGYQVGLIYSIKEIVYLYSELKTTANDEYNFNFIELGLKYKITWR